jgi:hypothetical protein
MWAVRVYRALQSRTKHRDAPSTFPLTIFRKGKEKVIDVPLKEYPILLQFPIFPPPAFLNPNGYANGILVSGVATVSFGPSPIEVAKRHKASSIKMSQSIQPVAFARVFAKIAFAMAAAERILERIDGDCLALPSIFRLHR